MANYPTISAGKTYSVVTDTFMGYNHQLKIPDGTFYNMKNMTSLRYPMLSSRPPRSTLNNTFTNLQAIIAKDALYWVDDGTMYANGLATGLTGLQTQKETQLVSMGAYICVFPDKKYINTMDLNDYGSMGASWDNSGGTVWCDMCNSEGTIYSDVRSSSLDPVNPQNGTIWVNPDNGSVQEYSSYTMSWSAIETVYTRITFETQGQIVQLFKEGDGVQISGLHNAELNGSKVIFAAGQDASDKDYIVVIGIQGESDSYDATISVSRVVPDMDYVCEAQNRLWGCFYGNDGEKNLNEIYCCALGDFKNWEQYQGISTDSWRASRGSDGPWTGCINYLGTPTFFKENVIHPVSVSSVGAHQIGDIPARGVQAGSHKSLTVVNETLYYKARGGVMAYQGGMPAEVGTVLGEERYYEATAGAFGNRYYISMRDSSGEWNLFCYDVMKGIWNREDDLHVGGFASWNDELYAMSNNRILALNGTLSGDDATRETTVDWFTETGIQYYSYPDKKYVSKYDIRVSMQQNAQFKIFIEYDSSGVWQYSGTVRMPRAGTMNIPVRPRRCDHMRMRFEGTGDVKIFSIARVLEKGSDK